MKRRLTFIIAILTVARVVLPRVLSIHQVKQLARVTPVPLEVFAFGSLCIASEGSLSVVVSDG